MPAARHITRSFRSQVPAQVKFAEAMLELLNICHDAKRSHAYICRRANVYESLLTAYIQANPKRRPDSWAVEKLYKAIQELTEETSPGRTMPYTLNDLQELRRLAAIKHCECCPEGRPNVPTAVMETRPDAAESEAGEPADDLASDDAESSSMLPVPSDQGDRQPLTASPLAWPALADVAQYLAAGRDQDARVIMHYVGATLPLDEVPDVVSACREGGLDVAAETILHYAGGRSAQDVLKLVRRLNATGRHIDVALLLDAAVHPHS